MCERVLYAFMKMCKAKYPQFSHFLSIYHTGEVEKSGSTDKTNRNILAKLKLYSNSFQNDCLMRKHAFKMTENAPKFRKPHNGQAKSGFSGESSSRFKLSTDLFPRKPALDQPDSRIDWAELLPLAATQCFSFPAAPLHLIPARSDTAFTPESMRQRRVCFSVRSVQSLAALNVAHTDSHGSVLSTTALITTPRAHFQPAAAPETRVKRPIAPKLNGIGSIC